MKKLLLLTVIFTLTVISCDDDKKENLTMDNDPVVIKTDSSETSDIDSIIPDNPCEPTPCSEQNRTACSVVEGAARCLCNSGFNLQDDICVENVNLDATFEKRIDHSADDFEQRADGSIVGGSSDIELVSDDTVQTIALRFIDVTVPKGALITSAWIQFTTDEVGSGTTNLVLYGENIDNSTRPTNTVNNISQRDKTTAFVNWDNVPTWETAGEATDDQKTPDLSTIVSEIVAKEGWVNGNALTFIVTGSGKRTAKSYEGSSPEAALLHIEYLDMCSPNPCNEKNKGICSVSNNNYVCSCNPKFHDESGVCVADPPDVIAPSAISDLAIVGSAGSHSLFLGWSATGDDLNEGTASSYDIRYSTGTITESNWSLAAQIDGEPAPSTTGNSEEKRVSGLTPETAYYFAMKVKDDEGNESQISNIVTARTAEAKPDLDDNSKIIFLHHSTGGLIWNGGVSSWMTNYNLVNGTSYDIDERAYPRDSTYGVHANYPYDYWRIWVENSGEGPYRGQDTLEIMTKNYDVIVWKHCYPVSVISEDATADIASSRKSLQNYKLQYEALKTKMLEFPDTRFIVWTGAVQLEVNLSIEQANRMREFVEWVKNEWDDAGDNIFLWDFYALETDGELYLKPEYARNPTNNHPHANFSQCAAPLMGQRIVDVIKGIGDTTPLTGGTMPADTTCEQ